MGNGANGNVKSHSLSSLIMSSERCMLSSLITAVAIDYFLG